MKGWASAVLVLALAGCGGAKIPDRPPSTVADFAGVLDGHTRDQLAGMIAALQRGANLDVAVVTVASLGGLTDTAYADKMYLRWHMGLATKARGILLLIAPTEQVCHITVGPGVANELPDQLRQAIVDRDLVPRFMYGNYPAGALAGLARLMQVYRLGPGPDAAPPGGQ